MESFLQKFNRELLEADEPTRTNVASEEHLKLLADQFPAWHKNNDVGADFELQSKAYLQRYAGLMPDKASQERMKTELERLYGRGIPDIEYDDQGNSTVVTREVQIQREKDRAAAALETGSEQSFGGDLLRSFGSGVLKTGSDIPRALGQAIETFDEDGVADEGSFAQSALETADSIDASINDVQDGREDNFAIQVAGGLGQVVGFLAAGVVGKGLTYGAKGVAGLSRAVGLTSKPAAAAAATSKAASGVRLTAASLPAATSALAQGGVAQAEDYVRRIEEDGGVVDQGTRRNAMLAGAAIGSLELFLPAKILGKFKADPDKFIGAALKNMGDSKFTSALSKSGVLKSAALEGGTEAAQELAFVAIGQALYDDDREGFIDAADDFYGRVAESGSVGGATGAIAEGVSALAENFFKGRMIKRGRTEAREILNEANAQQVDAVQGEALTEEAQRVQTEAQVANDQVDAINEADAQDDLAADLDEYFEDDLLKGKYPALQFLHVGGETAELGQKIATGIESAAKPIYMQSRQDQTNIDQLRSRYLGDAGVDQLMVDLGYDIEDAGLQKKLEKIQKAVDFNGKPVNPNAEINQESDAPVKRYDALATTKKQLKGVEGGEAVIRVIERMITPPEKLYDGDLVGETGLSNDQLLNALWAPSDTDKQDLHPIMRGLSPARRRQIEKHLEADDIKSVAEFFEGASNIATGTNKGVLRSVNNQLQQLTEQDAVYVTPEGYAAVGERDASYVQTAIAGAQTDINEIRSRGGAQFNTMVGQVASGQLTLEGVRDLSLNLDDIQANNQAISSAAAGAHLKALFSDEQAASDWLRDNIAEPGTRQFNNKEEVDFIREKYEQAVNSDAGFDIDAFASSVLDSVSGDHFKGAFADEMKRVKAMMGVDPAVLKGSDDFSPQQLFEVLRAGGLTKTEIVNSMRQLGVTESEIQDGIGRKRPRADDVTNLGPDQEQAVADSIEEIHDYFGYQELDKEAVAALGPDEKLAYRDLKKRVNRSIKALPQSSVDGVSKRKPGNYQGRPVSTRTFDTYIQPTLEAQGYDTDAIQSMREAWVGGVTEGPNAKILDAVYKQNNPGDNIDRNRLLDRFSANLPGGSTPPALDAFIVTDEQPTNAAQRATKDRTTANAEAAIDTISQAVSPATVNTTTDAPVVNMRGGLRRAWGKYFSSDGILENYGNEGREVSEVFKKMLGKISYAHESTVRLVSGRVEQMRDGLGGGEGVFDNMTKQQQDQILAGLRGDMDAVPVEIRPVVSAMRNDIDAMSDNILGVINKQIDFARDNTDPEASAQAIQRLENLASVIKTNKGSYLNRAYNAHVDPRAWRKKFINRDGSSTPAFEKIVDSYMDQTSETDRQAAFNEVKKVLEDNVSTGDQFNGLTGKLEDILKNKDQVPPWARDLLGEIDSPLEAYAMSVSKMSEWQAKNESELKMMELMQASGLARTTPVQDDGVSSSDYTRISQGNGFSSPAFQSMYVHRDVIDYMREFGFGELQDGGIRAANLLSSHMKTVMTAYNVDTHVRNWIGGPLALAANGNLSPTAFSMTAQAFKSVTRGGVKDKQAEDLRKFLVEERIVQDSASAADIIKAMTDGRMEEFGNEVFKAGRSKSALDRFEDGLDTLRFGKRISEKVGQFYQFPDDLFRTVNYMAEYQRIIDNSNGSVTEADARAEAALRTRKTMPSASESPGFVRKLRTPQNYGSAAANFILAQPFLTIAVATVQNRIEASDLAIKDIKSNEPWRQKRGRRQLVAQAVAVTAAGAAANYGIFEWEEETIDDNKWSDFFPGYLSGQEKYIEGIDGNNVIINSMQSTNPFSAMTNAADILLHSDIPLADKASGIGRIMFNELGGGSLPFEYYQLFTDFVQGNEARYDNMGDLVVEFASSLAPKELADLVNFSDNKDRLGFFLKENLTGAEPTQDEKDALANEAWKIANFGRTKWAMEDGFSTMGRTHGEKAGQTLKAAKDLFFAKRAGDDPEELANAMVDLANDHVEALKKIVIRSEEFRAETYDKTGWSQPDEKVLAWLQRGYSGISKGEYAYLVDQYYAGALQQVTAMDVVGGKRLFDTDSLTRKMVKIAEQTGGKFDQVLDERRETLKASLALYDERMETAAIKAAAGTN